MQKQSFCWVFPAFLISAISVAASAGNSDARLLLDLQADMQEFTDKATDTKQNVDYMPYVISTLDQNELSKLGVTNLREALKLVPGIDLSIGMAGVKNPIFRGSNPYSFSQSKLIIDGVSVNDQVFGAYNQYLEMPIDIIHRIEVVRGPGSLLNHTNGYAGSINVITKANRDDGEKVENQVFTSMGSNDYGMAGGVVGYQQGDLQLSADLYYQKHDLTLSSGTDRYGTEGELNEALDNYQLGLNLNYQHLSIKGRFSRNDSGVSSGLGFSLSEDFSDYLNVDNNSLELNYRHNLADKIDLDLMVGYFDESRKVQNKVMPDGAIIPSSGMTLLEGKYFLVDYAEVTYKQQVELNIRSFKGHKVVAGLFFSQSQPVEDGYYQSFDSLGTLSIRAELFGDNKREYSVAYLEDVIDLNEQATLQVGAKLEDYSDVDPQFSPRIALVYRYDEENVFKAMYSHAYREPSFREQYTKSTNVFYKPNVNLGVELVDAYELAYIRKLAGQSDFKVNLFYLENQDQIQADLGRDLFENQGTNAIYGTEWEYRSVIGKIDQIVLNYSYVEGSNIGDELANTASHMAMAYYIHQLNENWSVSGLYKYVGAKQRIEIDHRDNLIGYSTVDFASQYVSRENGLTVTVGIKNLFDESVVMPAPVGTYDEDFQQDGRSVFVRLKKVF